MIRDAFRHQSRRLMWVGDNIQLSADNLKRPATLYKAGQVTRAGRTLAGLWAPPEEHVYPGLPVELRDRREFVSLPSGRVALARTWKRGTWELTDIGKQLYQGEDIIIEVPVKVKGTGLRAWEVDEYLPISKSLAPRLNAYRSDEATKAYIKSLARPHIG